MQLRQFTNVMHDVGIRVGIRLGIVWEYVWGSVAHDVVLICCSSQEYRENIWEWLMDNMAMEFYSCLVQMDDEELLDVLFGQTLTLGPEFLDEFLVHCADSI